MSEDFVKKKRGRPVGNGKKYSRMNIRVDSDFERRIVELSRLSGMNKTEIIYEAFDIYEKYKRINLDINTEQDEYDAYDDFNDFDDETEDDF